MKRILIPTDFSSNAQNATNYGIALFDGEETEFVFLNAFYIPYVGHEVTFNYEDETSRKHAEELFDSEKKRIHAKFPRLKGKISCHFELGAVVEIANSFIKRQKIDYMVIGTKGASGLTEILVGSITSAMIKKVDIPMVIVPENARYQEPKKILFTTDVEYRSDDVDVSLLVDIAKKNNSLIHGFYVSKLGEDVEIDTTFIEYDLNIKFKDIRHDLDVDVGKDVVKAIESYADKYPIDLIAMISTKGNLFHEIFHRSVTKRVAMHTDLPLLIMHTKINK